MKPFSTIATFFLICLASVQPLKAQTLTVDNVKVSVRADSAASAQQQALDQAHQLAFQKLMEERFPERARALPSSDALRDMVIDFSIDREKTTPTSYTAVLTFQFNESAVLSWLQRGGAPSAYKAYEKNESLNITAAYKSHAEWHRIRKTLENFPDVQALSIFTLSPKNANIRITYRGPIDKLKQGLTQQGILLTQQEDGWVVSSNDPGLK